MSDIFISKARYSEWLETHTQESCLLKRGSHIEFIANYITSEHDGFVLNLNGRWGTGKTEFCKRLYTTILKKKHPVIYIDAWASDFSPSPLTVISSELLDQLNLLNNQIGTRTRRVSTFLGKALSGLAIAGGATVSTTYLGNPTAGAELVKGLLPDSSSEDIYKTLSGNYQKQVRAISEVRDSLAQLAEVLKTNFGAKLPIVVIVDELDRCRPTYAIELLEVIKHFFETNNFVFVVASDTEQLQHSIKTIYGQQFDSSKYLKRFFSRQAKLPLPPVCQYIKSIGINFDSFFDTENIKSLYLQQEDHEEILANLISSYPVEIRDVDQILSKIKSSVSHIIKVSVQKDTPQIVDLVMLTICIAEQHIESEEVPTFSKRSTTEQISTCIDEGKSDLKSIHLLTELSIAVATRYTDRHQNYYNEWIERDNLLINHERLERLHNNEDVLYSHKHTICRSCINSIRDDYVWTTDEYKSIATLASSLT